MVQILYSIIFRLFGSKHTQWSNQVGVSMVFGHDRIKMVIYMLSSLFFVLQKNYPVYVIDDGTLTDDDIHRLQRLFTVRVESVLVRDEKMHLLLSNYSHIHNYRFSSISDPRRLEFDALLLSPFKKTLYVDPDILFFRTPKEIVRWFDGDGNKSLYMSHDWTRVDNSLTPDFQHSFRVLLHTHFGFNHYSSLNAGMFCLGDKRVINLRRMNAICSLFHQLAYDRLSQSAEDILQLLFLSSKTAEVLPTGTYLVAPFQIDYQQGFNDETVCVHYCNRSKEYFYQDAIFLALKSRLFRL